MEEGLEEMRLVGQKGERYPDNKKMLVGLRLRLTGQSVHLKVFWGSFNYRKERQ